MHINAIDNNSISDFLFGNFDSENAENVFDIFFKFYFYFIDKRISLQSQNKGTLR